MQVLTTIFTSWYSILLGAFWLGVMITIIAFVHEFGHFVVAKWCGVKVEAFAIGMGREIFGFNDKHGTRWKFCMFPIGGYVQMLGQSDSPKKDDFKYENDDEKSHSFEFKSPWQKIAISIAGPLANVILAFVITVFILGFWGKDKIKPVVSHIASDSPAASAFKIGDEVLSVNGVKIDDFMQVTKIITFSGCNPLEFEILRKGKILSQKITPVRMETTDFLGRVQKRCMIGVAGGETVHENFAPIPAIKQGFIDTISMTGDTARGVYQLLTGQRTIKELSGPLKIGKISHEASKVGIQKFMMLIAIISIGVGVMNIVPIPVLDGGHILMNLIQVIIRREIPKKVQFLIYNLGFGVVILLMLAGFINDFRYLIKL
ncbi:M50 family metallopeptidase [Candidatus Deianiraea vastatrix]|uniref:Zinc metalloprotease n=1 Tax=Candidatus Deianiraea vastatrix TaxID=2163644 RepID=A0A5B8XCV7_9RICK|nr:M50 family metallopeptidase [Candidatus Deianiraea vastatrix]QED23152.1 Putative zinc metalloprotease [Candidatus Deianiraea vastatrix]